MQQYIDLVNLILNEGTYKNPARNGMPGTKSYFGHQMRFDLSKGFPLITTKKVSFKNIIVELLWFMKGDTNIKWLNENKFRLWNDDAFNYMQKKAKEQRTDAVYSNTEEGKKQFSIDIKEGLLILGTQHPNIINYNWGDCGYQYGRIWRSLETDPYIEGDTDGGKGCYISYDRTVDQFKNLLHSIKNNPLGRSHILTSWNPTTLDNMALNACHSFVQFNCRPISIKERIKIYADMSGRTFDDFKNEWDTDEEWLEDINNNTNVPQYYLDCQMYQRSADTLLGVPYNIASYSLLTHIIAKLMNMIPGNYVHTFGDVHVYEDHLEMIKEQITREPLELPKLSINTEFWETESGECGIGNLSIPGFLDGLNNEYFLQSLINEDIQLSNYIFHEGAIKGKLSTGLNI